MLSLSGLVQWFTNTMLDIQLPPIFVIILFLFVLLILGFFIDSTSIMLMTLPFMVPVVRELGYSLIWFGVLVTVVLEMGVINPPFGLVAFSMKAALGDKAEITDIFRGSVPFLGMLFIYTIILILFPSISTWLPELWM
jgi:TRAP-type C4-dicarboxylate transport system permease large subunit